MKYKTKVLQTINIFKSSNSKEFLYKMVLEYRKKKHVKCKYFFLPRISTAPAKHGGGGWGFRQSREKRENLAHSIGNG